MKIGVPDLVSNSYFPAVAAVELDILRASGIAAEIELISPAAELFAALQQNEVQFVASAAHSPLTTFPQWKGIKLLAALSQGTYWLLVLRSDLEVDRGDLTRLGGLRIGAGLGPDLAFRQLLREAGVDAEAQGIEIGPIQGMDLSNVSFGIAAAEALAAGQADGFWANGMGAEVAIRRGTGRLVLDVRRGDGPPGAASYTFPALMTTDDMIKERPGAVAAVVRGVVTAQNLLRESPSRAWKAGQRLFPELEASLIAELVERDVPFYDPMLAPRVIESLNDFTQAVGLVDAPAAYDAVVADTVRGLWQ